jgi:predicted nucleic acid-binding protein
MTFIETAYVQALVNVRDRWHAAAALWERYLNTVRPRYITTEYILVEIADGLAAVRFRQQAHQIIQALLSNAHVEVVPASTDLLKNALDLYYQRPDKEWGLTDCASFVVMNERGLIDALTSDNDFRQAGFRPLLLEEPPAG